MSVSGIASSLFNFIQQATQTRAQKFQQEFQQLGQDLQSGNLSAAQTDFATLQQSAPPSSSTSSVQSTSPLAQAFTQLSQDLQAGNTTAAQQDFATVQQDLQTESAQPHHHHHHGGGGGESSAISQLLSQLGQSLQSGKLATAKQTYATLQQDFQQSSQPGGAVALPQSTSTPVSVTA